MTTEYTTYSCSTCKKPLSLAELMNHACGVTEEMVRSLIADAITDKEEHIRRVVREEVQKTRVPWDVLRKEMLKHVPSASFCEGPKIGSSEVRFDKEPPFPFKTTACESSATSFSGVPSDDAGVAQQQSACSSPAASSTKPSGKATFDKNEQPFGVDSRYNRCDCCGEMVDPMDPSWRHAGDHWQHQCKGVDAQAGHPGTATKADPSPLREFVEAADELRTCVADGWSEANRYDAARSRFNVDKLSSQASEAYGNGRSNALVKSEAEMSALRLERERLRSELEKASKDMDDIANAWSDGHDPDWFRRVVAVLKRTGRLGGSK